MHEGAEKAKPIGQATQAGESKHSEIHKEGGKIHTIHHPGGERKEHGSMHEAHQAVNEHMGEDGCSSGGDMESAAMGSSSEY
jgi:hypothetical protein